MPLFIIRQDITRMKVDAIVNAANTDLVMGGGVCGAIFRAAGEQQLARALLPLGPIRPGQAVITPGFGLSAKYIIHTPGPVWEGGEAGEEATLSACYQNSLALAMQHGLKSIAFPLISSGVYDYPPHLALQVAQKAILDVLDQAEEDLNVTLIVFSGKAFLAGQALLGRVESYVSQRFVDESLLRESSRSLRRADSLLKKLAREQFKEQDLLEEGIQQLDAYAPIPDVGAAEPRPLAPQPSAAKAQPKARQDGLKDFLDQMDKTFSEALLAEIDRQGLKDSQVYKRANLDRRLFSKIRSNKHYVPSKRTALALCIALGLNSIQVRDLLRRAGYALSNSQQSDLIISYFIEEQIYDLFAINQVLFQYQLPLLGM